MMCTFGAFWWVFLFACAISFCVLILVPSETAKVALVVGIICFASIVLLIIAGSAKSDLRCKEMKYQAVLDKRAGLVQECPDREKPGCQLKWIRYQKDSLEQYLRVLR